MTTHLVREINSLVFLGVLAAWSVNGAATSDRRDRIDNIITFEIGAVFFGLALGFYQAANGGNPAWRVAYFTVVGCALFVTLAYRVAHRNDPSEAQP